MRIVDSLEWGNVTKGISEMCSERRDIPFQRIMVIIGMRCFNVSVVLCITFFKCLFCVFFSTSRVSLASSLHCHPFARSLDEVGYGWRENCEPLGVHFSIDS